MRGDALYVVPASGGSKEWQGFVHMVRQEEVLLRFNARFHNQVHMDGMRFNVRFSLKRSSFVFMHEALDVIARGVVAGSRSELLLPPADARCVAKRVVLIPRWFNSNIATNPEQQEAVRCVVSGSSGKLPFIIWGPPGTGKTSTLVEAAAQVLKLLPSSRLLMVAPSNLAADLLAQRLIKWGRPKSETLRVCAFSRPKEDLPTDLLDITCWDEAACAFKLPSLEAVMAKRVRVVVVTAHMAAKLHALGVPAGHFSHIMMDEAGHAEEPLALCALAGHTGRNTSVVLAGDPKQLGPVVHSRLAGKEGLRLSLLERLTASLPYAAAVDSSSGSSGGSTEGADPAAGLIVKLVRNYRSHPKLLELPSRLFYAGDLQACASPEITHTLLHWEQLPNKSFPILFHSIVGKDEREANSPSWFNVLEAKMVLAYVQELLSVRGRNPVTADQIAVITPYRKQVQKLRVLLKGRGMEAVQVGSVEQLQGQERRVIIISTVRSDPTYLEHDFRHKLGFVASTKRFNVAITRAQALMIVVGNPSVLMHDKHWLQLMLNCQAHGSVTGQPMPDLAAAAAAAAQADESAGEAAGSGASSGVEHAVAELEKLMASLTLSRAADQVAAQQQLLQDMLVGFSGLAVETGGGMVRHE